MTNINNIKYQQFGFAYSILGMSFTPKCPISFEKNIIVMTALEDIIIPTKTYYIAKSPTSYAEFAEEYKPECDSKKYYYKDRKGLSHAISKFVFNNSFPQEILEKLNK